MTKFVFINDAQEFIPMIVGILKMHNIACVAMTIQAKVCFAFTKVILKVRKKYYKRL